MIVSKKLIEKLILEEVQAGILPLDLIQKQMALDSQNILDKKFCELCLAATVPDEYLK